MEKILFVSVFAFSLFLKIAIAAGAESETNVGDEGEPAAVAEKSTTIQNTINVTPNQMATPAASSQTSPMLAQTNPNTDAASVLGTSQRDQGNQSLSITPLVGTTGYNGSWYDHVKNSYTFGLLLDIPASEQFSVELEGTYAKSYVSYSNFGHDFNQYSVGSNGKFYLSRSVIQPYVGVGMAALRYENMSYGPSLRNSRYSQWMGAAQAIAGVDVEVAKHTAVGIRGQWVLPVINRPSVQDNGRFAYPYYEEASLMNTTFFRVMGSVRLSF